MSQSHSCFTVLSLLVAVDLVVNESSVMGAQDRREVLAKFGRVSPGRQCSYAQRVGLAHSHLSRCDHVHYKIVKSLSGFWGEAHSHGSGPSHSCLSLSCSV